MYVCPKANTRADWFSSQSGPQSPRARPVNVMMARTKRIYILMIKVNKLTFLFASRYFLNEMTNLFSVCHRITETLVKVWENSKKSPSQGGGRYMFP